MTKQTAMEWFKNNGVDTTGIEKRLSQMAAAQAEKRDSKGKVLSVAEPPSRETLEAVITPFLNSGNLNVLAGLMADEALVEFAKHPGIDYPRPAAEITLEAAVKAVLEAQAKESAVA